jgi:Ca-activated chloride channel family protein
VGSKGRLIDPLRYGQDAAPAADPGGELAFLRLRYKRPGESESRLIERPITDADLAPALARAPEQTRWAIAVTGFGQLLRGDPYLDRSYGWTNVIDLAQGARGRDEFGWRAEFVQLARAAQTAQAAAPPVVPSQGEPPRRRPPPTRPVPQPRSN